MAVGRPSPGSAIAHRTRSHAPGLRQLGIFGLAYLVYFGVRAITQGSARDAVAHALELIRLERDLGIDWEEPVQQVALQSQILVDGANAVYMYGHWPVIVVAGALLFRYRPSHYFRLRDACLMSGLIGLVIFSVFPVAPPRLTDLPLVDTVTRDDAGYRQIIPPSMVNEYAALPSFHVGWNLLLGIVVFGATRHWLLRALSILGPASMAVAVVVTANHYVVDVVTGAVIVIVCLVVRDAVHGRRSSRPSRGRRWASTANRRAAFSSDAAVTYRAQATRPRPARSRTRWSAVRAGIARVPASTTVVVAVVVIVSDAARPVGVRAVTATSRSSPSSARGVRRSASCSRVSVSSHAWCGDSRS